MDKINIAGCSSILVLYNMPWTGTAEKEISEALKNSTLGICVTNDGQHEANDAIRKLKGIAIARVWGSYRWLTFWAIPGHFFTKWEKVPVETLIAGTKKKRKISKRKKK